MKDDTGLEKFDLEPLTLRFGTTIEHAACGVFNIQYIFDQ
jgi:hypothetical protein